MGHGSYAAAGTPGGQISNTPMFSAPPPPAHNSALPSAPMPSVPHGGSMMPATPGTAGAMTPLNPPTPDSRIVPTLQ